MAHLEQIVSGGRLVEVQKLDHTAQQVDDAIDRIALHSNENLLDNEYFVDPINQRGLTAYVSAGQRWVSGYGIDRWSSDADVTLGADGLSISAHGYDSIFFQIIESNRVLDGNVYTVSALLADGTLLVASGVMDRARPDNSNIFGNPYPNPYSVSVSVTAGKNVSTILHMSAGITCKPKAAKLELGPVQTLAHKEGDTWVLNDPPPNKALELLKCQRYQVFGNMFAPPLTVSNNDAYCLLPLPTTLRAKPTLVGTPGVREINNNDLVAGTAAIDSLSENGITLRVPGASKLVYIYGSFGLDANL